MKTYLVKLVVSNFQAEELYHLPQERNTMAALSLPKMKQRRLYLQSCLFSFWDSSILTWGGGGVDIYKEGHFILYNIAVINCPVTYVIIFFVSTNINNNNNNNNNNNSTTTFTTFLLFFINRYGKKLWRHQQVQQVQHKVLHYIYIYIYTLTYLQYINI